MTSFKGNWEIKIDEQTIFFIFKNLMRFLLLHQTVLCNILWTACGLFCTCCFCLAFVFFHLPIHPNAVSILVLFCKAPQKIEKEIEIIFNTQSQTLRQKHFLLLDLNVWVNLSTFALDTCWRKKNRRKKRSQNQTQEHKTRIKKLKKFEKKERWETQQKVF